MICKSSVCSVGFSVLNKSKWKGGTLRIEIAKESFLQRCSHLDVLLGLQGGGGILLQYILTREYLFFYVSDWLKSDRLQQNWIFNVHLLKTRDRRCWIP